ncbi:MAG: CBS domain-containing protein [Phaeodactylibacter sp.]|nr:CBS domain-containing protein [Phaeodactylibacter sp.]
MATIKQLMTTNVLVVHPNDTMLKVHELFHSNTIHHLPVVDAGNRVIGMISKSDYLAVSNALPLFKPEKREAANVKLFQSLLVEDVMTRQVATLAPEDALEVAIGYFKENMFHAIPIVDPAGRLAGILSTYDLLVFFFDQQALLN